MPATFEPIASTTLSAATASVTFSSIPQTFTDIVIVASVKLTSGSNSSIDFRVNGDSTSLYSNTRIQGDGTTAESGRSSGGTSGKFSGGGFAVAEATSTFSPIIFSMMNYSNTTTNKTFLARGNTASAGTGASVSLWRSTTAINSINIFPIAGSLDSGSTFNLYGIRAGA